MAPMSGAYNPELLDDFLPLYYGKLFPIDTFYKWITYADKSRGANREISFTLRDDVYIRFQSFSSMQELQRALKDKRPHKIDIGAVYNYNPKNHHEPSFGPIERELVFDIDMTDYDDVRTCCQGAEICRSCWAFMTLAMKILDRVLREDFGFKHILWVYSGRRGVHCWVCDARARRLRAAARAAIANYISLLKSQAQSSKKVSLFKSIHPSVRETLKIVKEYFPAIALQNQKLLEGDKFWHDLVSASSDSSFKDDIEKSVLSQTSSEKRWEAFETIVEKQKSTKYMFLLEEIMLELCYPRLDVAVTKGTQHLLKAPFSVHPKTGRVCVPIDITNVTAFDPFAVPTVSQLSNEIDEYDAQHKGDEAMDVGNPALQEYKKTGLASSVLLFQGFVDKICLAEADVVIKKIDQSMEF
ncbi:DNA primase small subunit isoform X2 [Dermacentor albipictus]|uniref:DNA primase small subunit isoform X2 n=1 Tax=Dermacentor albipictus TaxID=60249 RepID=UPI0031FD6C9E